MVDEFRWLLGMEITAKLHGITFTLSTKKNLSLVYL